MGVASRVLASGIGGAGDAGEDGCPIGEGDRAWR